MALRTKTSFHQRQSTSASRMKHHLPHEFLVGQTALHSSELPALTITSANSSKCNKILGNVEFSSKKGYITIDFTK